MDYWLPQCKKEFLKDSHSYYLWICSYSLPKFTVNEIKVSIKYRLLLSFCLQNFCDSKNLKAMNVKFSGLFFCWSTIHLLLHDLHGCTFKINPTYKNLLPSKSLQFHNITSKLRALIPLTGDAVSAFRCFTNVDIGCPLEGLQR